MHSIGIEIKHNAVQHFPFKIILYYVCRSSLVDGDAAAIRFSKADEALKFAEINFHIFHDVYSGIPAKAKGFSECKNGQPTNKSEEIDEEESTPMWDRRKREYMVK